MLSQKNPLRYAHVTECEGHRFVAEASDLGLHGPMPEEIATDMGNGLPFRYRRTERDREGDVQGWEYRQDFGPMTLIIFND